MNYHTRYKELCQEVPSLAEPLLDVGRNGKERPWRKYKLANEYLAMAYDEVNPKKADRLRVCATTLGYDVDGSGKQRLAVSDHCRVRLCPLCSWRRSIKNYWTARKVTSWIKAHESDANVGRYEYVFITLTVRNVYGEDLSAEIDTLYYGVKKLFQTKEFRAAFHGAIRNLEVTHNLDINSKDYNTYHPHFHCLVAVKPSYWKKAYITQGRLTELWRAALGVDYKPRVHIEKVYGRTLDEKPDRPIEEGETPIAHAVAESVKYGSKPGDYIIPDDWDLSVDAVRVLDQALANRRLINYSGIFREVKALLNLEDPEDGDLTHVDGDELVLNGKTHRVYYKWYAGYRQYYKV